MAIRMEMARGWRFKCCRIPAETAIQEAYCLASPGREYLVYIPEGREVNVDLSATATAFSVEWFDPKTGAKQRGSDVHGGVKCLFQSPLENDAVLYLKATDRQDQQP